MQPPATNSITINFSKLVKAKRRLGVWWLLAATAYASAGETASVAAVTDASVTLKAVLEARIPQLQIEAVQKAPWPGMYEVLTPTEIIYSDAKGDLVFVGKIVDTQKREDLTAKRWQEAQRIDFNSLPFDKAIKFVKGDGSRRLAVFEDPQCPFCERFEQALESVNNITVYLFLFPIKELHPNADSVARNIWCAPDRGATWSAWMLKKVTPPPAAASCASDPVADIVKLGEKLKINGTPTVFFVDGDRIPGALTAVQLESALAERVAAK